MRKTILLAAGLLALMSGSAFANQTCLEIGQIDSWKVIDNKTLVIQDEFHNRFKAELFGNCQSLAFKERLAFKSMGATQMSCLSKGDDVIVRNIGTGGQRCPIKSIVPYTPDMEKADIAAAAAAKADGH